MINNYYALVLHIYIWKNKLIMITRFQGELELLLACQCLYFYCSEVKTATTVKSYCADRAQAQYYKDKTHYYIYLTVFVDYLFYFLIFI